MPEVIHFVASQAKYRIAEVSARKTWAFSTILIKLTLYKVTIFTLHFARNTNHFADTPKLFQQLHLNVLEKRHYYRKVLYCATLQSTIWL